MLSNISLNIVFLICLLKLSVHLKKNRHDFMIFLIPVGVIPEVTVFILHFCWTGLFHCCKEQFR